MWDIALFMVVDAIVGVERIHRRHITPRRPATAVGIGLVHAAGLVVQPPHSQKVPADSLQMPHDAVILPVDSQVDHLGLRRRNPRRVTEQLQTEVVAQHGLVVPLGPQNKVIVCIR